MQHNYCSISVGLIVLDPDNNKYDKNEVLKGLESFADKWGKLSPYKTIASKRRY